MLPSVSSLAALRRNAKASGAPQPFIGFGNPVLDGTPSCGKIHIPETCPEEEITTAAPARHACARLGAMAHHRLELFPRRPGRCRHQVRELCPLPDTAHELKCVAKSLGAPESSIVLGKDMTETAVKTMALDRYRVVHFATHGLLAGETAQLAKDAPSRRSCSRRRMRRARRTTAC